jgi:(E)-4-hydroxy-3-methylbut-2-enyl-diphosphate synthase
MIKRRKTRQINIGKVKIGGSAPVSVQSMTNTRTEDIKATLSQIRRLEEVGCEIVRVAVPTREAAARLGEIKSKINIPLVADIHFDYQLAIMAVNEGIDGLRINPGNIGGREKVEKVVRAAKKGGIPIRIGVNSGSLEKYLLERYGGPGPEALVESALRCVKVFEGLDFYEIKISLKSPDVLTTMEAYRMISKIVDYPLHLGITEAGTLFSGVIKSSLGIGILLNEGIGDTIRVSLTADPVEEVRAGYEILKGLKLRSRGVEMISCPTCGRCEIDLVGIANEVEKRLAKVKKPIKVAVMGCVVNGPGEAKEADIGIAGGKGSGLLFKRGKAVKKLKEEEMVKVLVEEVDKVVG